MTDVPDFINPPTINNLSDDEIRDILEKARDARLKARNLLKETEAAKSNARSEKLAKMLDKMLATMKKMIEALDKWIDKYEALQVKIMATRLELDDNFTLPTTEKPK